MIMSWKVTKDAREIPMAPLFIYLFIYLFIIHSHSLKSIKLYMVQITNQNRLPAPQYNILERDKID